MIRTTTLLAGVLATIPLLAGAQETQKAEDSMPGIELGELLQRFASRTGKQFVIDPRVRGQAPLAGMDAGRLTYDQLLAVLDVHQLAVVDSGGILAVVPDANARQFPTPVYTDARFEAADHETVTLLVTPKRVCAAMLVPVLRPLQQQAAHLAAETQTNTLIINDHAVNARRIAELVDQLDRRGPGIEDCSRPAAKPGS